MKRVDVASTVHLKGDGPLGTETPWAARKVGRLYSHRRSRGLTVEGWAPQTFKSSRTNRANKVQRAEDFMDEEDLAQMNEDRKLENTETFRNEGFTATREELGDKE